MPLMVNGLLFHMTQFLCGISIRIAQAALAVAELVVLVGLAY